MAEIILLTDGKPHYGWKDITIDRSIENGAWAFDLSMTERWGGGHVRPIRAGQSCQVKLDNELLITGYIDSANAEHDKSSHGIRVAGRSKTADLIDCSLPGREFKNQTLVQIATTLCKPFGITVVDFARASGKFSLVRLATGQPVYEFLEYLARIRAVRLIPDVGGNLVITRAGAESLPTVLALGDNIESASALVDYGQVFSDYTVVAQQDDVLTLNPATNAHPKGAATDSRISRYRPVTVESDSPMDSADCKTRAEWMRNTHFGRGRSGTITVPGWQQTPGGKSWTPNSRVQVDDSAIGLVGERLIVRARMRLDESGSRTEITVMPKAAFELHELPEPDDAEVYG